VAWPNLHRPGDEVGNLQLERFVRQLRLGLQVDQAHAAIGQPPQLVWLLGTGWVKGEDSPDNVAEKAVLVGNVLEVEVSIQGGGYWPN
jgi:hypothetical protein